LTCSVAPGSNASSPARIRQQCVEGEDVLHERRTTPFRMLPLITWPGPPPANLAPVALPRGGNPPRPLRAPAGVSAPAAQSSRRRTDPPASASRQTPRRTRCTAPWPCARPAHPRSASSQPSIERNRDTEISNHGPGARRRSANRRSGVILGAESASGAARGVSTDAPV
jgi:hypothetical protein